MTDNNEQLRKKFSRLQELILTSYPNPDRVGCPPQENLKATAERDDLEQLFSEPVWDHITHCSPCYSEYLALRKAR